MIISICSLLFDYAADFIVEADYADTTANPIARRLSRSATLDGGCVIVDNGYSAADATFIIALKELDTATQDAIKAMIIRHSLLVISIAGGIYSGAVETLEEKNYMKIRFLVKAQLNS